MSPAPRLHHLLRETIAVVEAQTRLDLAEHAVLDHCIKRKRESQGLEFAVPSKVQRKGTGRDQLRHVMRLLESFKIKGCARNPHQVALHMGMVRRQYSETLW